MKTKKQREDAEAILARIRAKTKARVKKHRKRAAMKARIAIGSGGMK